MSEIIVAGGGDVRCNLAVGDVARLHGINTWGTGVTLRIGCRATGIHPPVTAINGAPKFGIGLCSGVTNPPMHPDGCDHFLGWGAVSGTWGVPTPGTNSAYYDNTIAKAIAMKDSTEVVAIGVSPGNFRLWAANTRAAQDGFMILFCDIVNGGGGNWTVSGYYTDTGHGIDTPTSADFQAQMKLAVPTWPVNSMNVMSASVNVNEGLYGTLDAYCVFWNRYSVTFDLLDVACVRLA